MAVKVEVGTWTANNTSPQTITLADTNFGTPIAIIAWTASRATAPAAGAFASDMMLTIGFGTYRGGVVQQATRGISADDNVATTNTARFGLATTLLRVASDSVPNEDYRVSLSSFGNAQFVVTYNNAGNANGDTFHYMIFGGSDLTDAIVIDWTMASTGSTEVITGAGFQPNVLFALDFGADAGSLTTGANYSFGVATSATSFWSTAISERDGVTTAESKRSWRTDACMERLNITPDTTNARWDLNSFDTDGVTLGVVDPPSVTSWESAFLFIQGGQWEAGSFAKRTNVGDDTISLGFSSQVRGVLLGTVMTTATGLTLNNATMILGAGSTASSTRSSAVNNCVGVVGPENINTTEDRFRATDSIIEELTGGTTPTETSEAWLSQPASDAAKLIRRLRRRGRTDARCLSRRVTPTGIGNGQFTITWATNGGSANLIGYLAVGDT